MATAPAAIAGAAVRRFGDAVITGDVVDHDRAGVEARGEFAAAASAGGPDTRAEGKRRIVGERDGFVGVFYHLNRENRAEGFFAHQVHGVIDLSDDGGVEKIRAEVGAAIAAGEHARAAFFCFGDLLLDFFELARANQRADFRVGIGGRPEAESIGFFDAESGELVDDGRFGVNTLDRDTGLAAIHEAAPDRGAGGDVQIGVGENDHGIFAAEFERGRNQLFGAGFGDALAGGDAAGEKNFVGAGGDEGGAEIAAALDDLYEILGKFGLGAEFGEQFTDERAGPRGQFGRLQDYRITGGESRDDLGHRNRERVVPRRNDGDNAERVEFEPAGFGLHGEIVVRNFFGPQPLRGAFGDEVGGVERQQNFGEDGFDAGLAGFAGDDVGDFVAIFEDGVAKIFQHGGAGRERPGGPSFVRGAGGFEDFWELGGVGGVEGRVDFVGGGI